MLAESPEQNRWIFASEAVLLWQSLFKLSDFNAKHRLIVLCGDGLVATRCAHWARQVEGGPPVVEHDLEIPARFWGDYLTDPFATDWAHGIFTARSYDPREGRSATRVHGLLFFEPDLLGYYRTLTGAEPPAQSVASPSPQAAIAHLKSHDVVAISELIAKGGVGAAGRPAPVSDTSFERWFTRFADQNPGAPMRVIRDAADRKFGAGAISRRRIYAFMQARAPLTPGNPAFNRN